MQEVHHERINFAAMGAATSSIFHNHKPVLCHFKSFIEIFFTADLLYSLVSGGNCGLYDEVCPVFV